MKSYGLIAVTCLAAAACGPKDVIPYTPSHPANPSAPPAAEAPPEADAGAEPPAAEGHEGHGTNGQSASADTEAVAAEEKAAYERARPVFETYCVSCHTSAGKGKKKKKALKHFSMDSYPFGGHHAEDIGETIREVLGATGKKPTMPANRRGAVKGAELEAVIEWSKAFDKANEAGLHEKKGEHGGHH